MINATSRPTPYQSELNSPTHTLLSDAPVVKGGGGAGFGAHQLLEASLASCMNMAVRMHADVHGYALRHVSTQVNVDWPDDTTTRFSYAIVLEGDLTQAQRDELHAVADTCPVRRTLTNRLVFEKEA